jgi:transposase
MDSSADSVGIDVPESVLVLGKEEPIHGEQYSRCRGHHRRGLPEALEPRLAALCEEIASLSTRIEDVEAQLEALARQIPTVARLRSVPGIGLLSATALYAFIGDRSRFPSGRHMASVVGLTPREYSSGLRRHLGRISKRGDPYLRMLLIHRARSVLWHSKRMKHPDRLRS